MTARSWAAKATAILVTAVALLTAVGWAQEVQTGSLTLEGVAKALTQAAADAGYDEEAQAALQEKLDQLVAAGVPPGIVLRVAIQALSSGEEPDALLVLLEGLEEAIVADGAAPGRAANEVTGHGAQQSQHRSRHEERERNRNEVQGGQSTSGEEQERNRHPPPGQARGRGRGPGGDEEDENKPKPKGRGKGHGG